MRKIITIAIIILTSNLTFAQSVFDKLEDIDGVSSIIVNKDAFKILSKFKQTDTKDTSIEIFKIIKNLEELKVFKTQDPVICKKIKKMVKIAITKYNLTELIRARDKESNVRIYVKTTKNKYFVNKVLMYIEGMNKKIETVVVLLTGVIDINKLSTISDTILKK